MSISNTTLQIVKSWLDGAQRVVFFTGAGMSAESGIPAFREAQTGIWARFDPEDLASPKAFAHHPEKLLQWYAERRLTALSCKPHKGYLAIADLEKTHDVTVITQNVDRLHQRSGSTSVIELHGNLIHEHCQRCGSVDETTPNRHAPFQKTCRLCKGPLRPSVVWFGETLPSKALKAAEAVLTRCDILFIVGTSASVYPAAFLPKIAKQSGAKVILINPYETEHVEFSDVYFPSKAGSVLEQIL